MKVIKQLLPGVVLLLVLVLGSVYWFQRDSCDCRKRIDYSNVDLYNDLKVRFDKVTIFVMRLNVLFNFAVVVALQLEKSELIYIFRISFFYIIS